MPRHYSPEEKAAALVRLAENRGSITMTAHQLGIPRRTLRDWRQQDWLEKVAPPFPAPPPSPPPPPPLAGQQSEEHPPFENDLDAVEFMRRQMLDDLVEISRTLRQDFACATPYQRLVIIPRLLDRLMKLDQLLRPYRPTEAIRLELADSEGEEPDGDEAENELEFLLLRNGEQYGPFAATGLRDRADRERQQGYNPVIRVRCWNRSEDDEEIEWEGTLIFS
jgi:transposase-like protein